MSLPKPPTRTATWPPLRPGVARGTDAIGTSLRQQTCWCKPGSGGQCGPPALPIARRRREPACRAWRASSSCRQRAGVHGAAATRRRNPLKDRDRGPAKMQKPEAQSKRAAIPCFASGSLPRCLLWALGSVLSAATIGVNVDSREAVEARRVRREERQNCNSSGGCPALAHPRGDPNDQHIAIDCPQRLPCALAQQSLHRGVDVLARRLSARSPFLECPAAAQPELS